LVYTIALRRFGSMACQQGLLFRELLGPRTIAAILRVMRLSEERQFERFHRVLNRVKWSPLMASRRLLMALGDTIERRRGAKIAARGICRDPVQSSPTHLVRTSGLCWLCLMLVVSIDWARRHWALPFCSVLAPSERYYLHRRRRPCRLADRARQALLLLKRSMPDR
jgi:hypothetical protein